MQERLLKSSPSEAAVGMATATCAGGVIAPLTLQTENLIKCDTED